MKNVFVLLVALGWAALSFAQTAPAPERAPRQLAQVSGAGGASRGASAMSTVVEYTPTAIFYVGFVAVAVKALTTETTSTDRH